MLLRIVREAVSNAARHASAQTIHVRLEDGRELRLTVTDDGRGFDAEAIGRDGGLGLLTMREAGARTLGQDEATSVVYGMPKAAFELGAVERQLPLHRLSSAILELCADPAVRSVA
jgi:signal transduction histidine kinase